MVLKYSQFINEAKKDKNALVELLVKILKDKPKIEMGKTFPTEKDAYTIAGIKKYFAEHGMTKDNADDALYYISNDKEFKDVKSKLKHFSAKNSHYNENYPYHYMDLNEDEVQKVKQTIEKESAEQAKPEIEKRELSKKRHLATAKEKEVKKTEKKTTERKTTSKRTTKK